MLIAAALVSVVLCASRACAEDKSVAGPADVDAAEVGDAGLNVAEVGKWPTERIVRKDGRVFEGLVRDVSESSLELVEVGRKPGRLMYLLVRTIPRNEISTLQRLGPAKRRELENHIAQFRNRARILAARLDQIRLEQRSVQDLEYLFYRGTWFSLASTADEELTRLAIVRVEQMFAGFRTFIRPRLRPQGRLRVILLNKQDEYLRYQRRANLNIKNPAYFDPVRNEIVAGGNLTALANRLQEVQRHHAQLLERQKKRDVEMRNQLEAMGRVLARGGSDPEEIRLAKVAANRQWRELADRQAAKIRQADRANDQLFQERFRILYHEAFHAYLENYVYDRHQFAVPRWLNEGLAQIFEGGMLDAGALRLDTPNPRARAALQDELRGGSPIPLADIVSASPRQFLVGHNDAAGRADKLYLYSWGLAQYLTYQMQLLDRPRLDQYLSIEAAANDPVERFERLVGMPLDAFQEKWRKAMLEL